MNKDKHSIVLLENSNSCHLKRGWEGETKQKKGTKKGSMTSHTLAKLTKLGQTKTKWSKI